MEIYKYMLNIYMEINRRYQWLCISSFPRIRVVKGNVVQWLKPEQLIVLFDWIWIRDLPRIGIWPQASNLTILGFSFLIIEVG